MLVLPIKKKWFDMIKSGEKKEEYKEIKKYYQERLIKYFGGHFYEEHKAWTWQPHIEKPVIFRNGYRHDSPKIKCWCTLDMREGEPTWRSGSRKTILCAKDKKN